MVYGTQITIVTGAFVNHDYHILPYITIIITIIVLLITIVTGAFVIQRSHHNGGPTDFFPRLPSTFAAWPTCGRWRWRSSTPWQGRDDWSRPLVPLVGDGGDSGNIW